MGERTFYATAMKSGNRLQVGINARTTEVLEILPGDELEVTVNKTGLKGRRSPESFGRNKKPASNTPQPESPASQPETSPSQKSTVPEHVIERVFLAKAKGVPVDQLRSAFNETTDYQWTDLPEKVRKELEA